MSDREHELIAQEIAVAYQRLYDRLALCPDHHENTTGRCIVCVAEERAAQKWRAENAALRAERDMAQESAQYWRGEYETSNAFARQCVARLAALEEALTALEQRWREQASGYMAIAQANAGPHAELAAMMATTSNARLHDTDELAALRARLTSEVKS